MIVNDMNKGEGETSMGKSCVFCKIIRGEEKASIVFEDDVSLAFLDSKPLLKGHCLLVPKEHVDTLDDLPENLLESVMRNTQLLSQAVQQALGAEGSFTAINTRISQSVPHMHIHVVPRWKGDGLFSPKLLWKRRPYRNEEEREKTAEAIRQAVAENLKGAK